MKRAGCAEYAVGVAATAHVSRWPTSSAVAPLTNTSAGCATPTVGAAAYWSAGSRHSSRLRESVVCRPACTPLLLPDGAEYELLQRAGEAGVVGVLVAAALLVSFYLALAVLARVWSGTAPVDMAGEPPRSGPAIDGHRLVARRCGGGFRDLHDGQQPVALCRSSDGDRRRRRHRLRRRPLACRPPRGNRRIPIRANGTRVDRLRVSSASRAPCGSLSRACSPTRPPCSCSPRPPPASGVDSWKPQRCNARRG